MTRVHLFFESELGGEVGKFSGMKFCGGLARAETFDHDAGVEDVAEAVYEDGAVKKKGLRHALIFLSGGGICAEAGALIGAVAVDVVTGEYVLRRVRCHGEFLPPVLPSENDKHAERLIAPLFKAGDDLGHAHFER